MNPFYFLVITLGTSVVIQGNLNRQIAGHWGLPTATLINACVFLALSGLLFLIMRAFSAGLPDFLRLPTQMPQIQWWYLIPGFCGFLLVFGLPWAFQNIGSAMTFILLVSSQVVMGLIWDVFVSQLTISRMTLIGAAITLVGAVVTVLGK